jgi:uncharacterized protein YlbG (UPF0298 family)
VASAVYLEFFRECSEFRLGTIQHNSRHISATHLYCKRDDLYQQFKEFVNKLFYSIGVNGIDLGTGFNVFAELIKKISEACAKAMYKILVISSRLIGKVLRENFVPLLHQL